MWLRKGGQGLRIITKLLQLSHNKSGVSNVIVVVLSLIIVVIVVSNVILWSYQMNQFDWEKMQENIKIVDFAKVTNSSWFLVQNEYGVNTGSRTNGSYLDTQAVDSQYESFRESSNWWNVNYSYRRQITIVNNSSSPLDMDYSVCVTIDTASLVAAGKTLSNGNDLRVVYWNGGDWIELNRDLLDMNTGLTRLWFKTQSIIDASPATYNNYYVYYGNPTATNPPANNSNVYIWFDDFSVNTLANYDKAKWVDVHGDANQYVLPTYDAVNERVWFDTGDNYASDMYPKAVNEANFLMEVDFWANGSYPRDATIALVGRLKNPGTSSTHYYLDFSHDAYDSPGITLDSWLNGERSNTVYSEPSDYYWGFNKVHTFRYAIFEGTHKFWWNKEISQPANVVATDDFHIVAGRVGLVPAQIRGWWDNLKIRKYVEPEPSTSLGPEEEQGPLSYRFDINGLFTIDISTYPLTYIKSVEVRLMYRANDTLEKWCLKAYNWTAMNYNDSGFNNTSGHTPTTSWDIYAVNLTDKWRSYVSDSGAINVKFQDKQTDVNQTIIDIDFFGVRVVIDETKFTFENKGSLTCRLVSLWVNNSTHHQRFEITLFVNSGERAKYTRADINLPTGSFIVKVVTKRGNVAVLSNH